MDHRGDRFSGEGGLRIRDLCYHMNIFLQNENRIDIRPSSATVFLHMVRRVFQILVLPLLFALLGAGGKTTFCSVLSTLGAEAHHHLHPCDDGAEHAEPLCFEVHDEEGSGHRHDTVPCPESCELRLSEALAPGLVKAPVLLQAAIPPALFELPEPVLSVVSDRLAAVRPEPLDEGPPLSAPTFTGRFLI